MHAQSLVVNERSKKFIRKRKRLFKKFKRTKKNITDYNNYKHLRNKTTTEIRNGLVVIFQETARNHFWEARMLMQSYMLDSFQ